MRPTIEARFNLKLNDKISRLKPIEVVRFEVINFIAGKNFTIRFPVAEPRIAPSSMKAIK